MSEDRIKEAFDSLSPSEEAKDRMFANILQALEKEPDSIQEPQVLAEPTVVPLPVKRRRKGLVRALSAAACFLILVIAGINLVPHVLSSKSNEAEMLATEGAAEDGYVDADSSIELTGESEEKYVSASNASSYPDAGFSSIPRYQKLSLVDWDAVPSLDMDPRVQVVWTDEDGLVFRISGTGSSPSTISVHLFQSGSESVWAGDVEAQGSGWSSLIIIPVEDPGGLSASFVVDDRESGIIDL